MRRIVVALCLAFCGGCVTTELTPAGNGVHVTSNPEMVRNCVLIGDVVGSDAMNGGLGAWAADENANRRLRNHAAAMGANVVLFVTNATGWHGSVQRGEAYRCEIGAEKRAALGNVHISNVVRRQTSNATLVSSFDISNANDFAVTSVSVECTVSGIGGNPLTALPALGPHDSRRVENVLFSAGGVPDGAPVCRVLDLTILR
jgi:hypothetical protein